ncbi:MAG: bile acid:sodium symporter [Gemmataceae bacterium]
MSKIVVDVSVPVLVIFAMVVVGTGLTASDFRRVVRRPRAVLVAVVGQTLLLPCLGWLLVVVLELQPVIATGLMLVAICPSGATANLYTQVARGDTALAVTLTAVSCVIAGITMPVALAALPNEELATIGSEIPQWVLVGQLLALLALPVLFGMGIRRRWPMFAERHGQTLLCLSVAALLLLMGLVIVAELRRFADNLSETASASGLLAVLAFATGWATGWSGRGEPDARFAVGMVFAVRNVGVATAVAVTVLGRAEFAVFATAYFLTQVPILIIASLLFRSAKCRDGANFPGVTLP